LGVPGLPPAALFNSVGLAHFDGKGHLSWVEHTIVNGRPLNVDFIAARHLQRQCRLHRHRRRQYSK
jgi:hypothetical protein